MKKILLLCLFITNSLNASLYLQTILDGLRGQAFQVAEEMRDGSLKRRPQEERYFLRVQKLNRRISEVHDLAKELHNQMPLILKDSQRRLDATKSKLDALTEILFLGVLDQYITDETQAMFDSITTEAWETFNKLTRPSFPTALSIP